MTTQNARVPLSEALNLGSEVIVVHVGSEKIQFQVHANLIRARSPFFNAALSHDWKEKTEQTLVLPEEDPQASDLYLTWLYTQKIASKTQFEDDLLREYEYKLLANSIVLGEILQDVRFKNALIDALITAAEDQDEKGLCHMPSRDAIRIMYDGTPSTAPVRRLLVEMWTWNGEGHWITPLQEDYFHKSFLLELAAKLLKERIIPSSTRPCTFSNKSLYHENAKQEAEQV